MEGKGKEGKWKFNFDIFSGLNLDVTLFFLPFSSIILNPGIL